VPDHRVGDAAHQQPAYRTQTATADHYQAHVQRLGRPEDLLVRISAPEVGLRHLPALSADLLGLLFEEPLGVPLGPPDERLPYLLRVEVVAHELRGRRQHVD
jgi:hypothetical protein